MRRTAAVAIVLVAIATAATAAQDYADIESSDCWSCHSPGNEYVMDPAFAIDPGFAQLDGEEVRLRPAIVNTWKAELSEMSLTMDLSEAPDISFAGDRAAEQGAKHANITIDPTTVDGTNTFVTAAHRASVHFPVPGGASALRLRLVPAGDVSNADLAFRIYSGDARTPFRTIDETGAGEGETYTLSTPEEIGEVAGPWRLEAEARIFRAADNRIDPQATQIPVRFEWEAWYNASQERLLVQTTDETLRYGQQEIFPFDLVIGDAAGQRITLLAKLHIHYDHTSAAVDDEWMQLYLDVPVAGDLGNLTLGSQAGPVIPVPDNPIRLDRISEAIGYAAAFLLAFSMVSGGIFGKASRRSMNTIFGGARRRVAFHNFLSYGIIAAAIAHLVLFLVETQYHWTQGVLWGGTGILMLLMLGVTGALQVPMIRKWNYATWRWVHLGIALAAVLFTLVHIGLDGAHFGDFQQALGWEDPLVPAR